MKKLSYCLIVVSLLAASCSTTKNLPEGEVLYTGIHQIAYVDQGQKIKKLDKDTTGVITAVVTAAERVNNLLKGDIRKLNLNAGGKDGLQDSTLTKDERRQLTRADASALATATEEVNAVLEYAPNNSLFGSSYHRSPFAMGLWAYNAHVNKKSGYDKWMFKAFATEPVLISSVNPETRVKVAANTLRNYGYFHGKVKYVVEPNSSNSRKAKMNYFVSTGPLFHLDSITYKGFMSAADSVIHKTIGKSFLHRGDPFKVLNLTNEQSRLEKLFRNDGYYYYRANSATYLADTLRKPYKVQLVMQPKENLPTRMMNRFYMGNTYIQVCKHEGDSLTGEWNQHGMNIAYSGKKIPVRPIVWMQNIAHHPRSLYRQDDQEKTQEMLSSLGIFSQISLNYSPRDTTAKNDTLDLLVSTVLDKPWTSDIEMNVTEKNSDRIGPGLTLNLQRKNAFRGSELFNFKLYGNYEWRTHSESGKHSSLFNSYELGTQLSVDFPYIVFPGLNRRSFHFPTSTKFSLNADWLNRADYFNLFSSGIQVAYSWHKNNTSKHELIPFMLTYDKLLNSTHEFDSIMKDNPSLYVSMRNRFVPAMQYTYTYVSSDEHRNPLWWQLTVKEAGNVTSGLFALAGRKFGDKNKNLFNNPFAQYLKVTSELHNTFKIKGNYKIVTRLMGGIVYSYGNSDVAPYSDQFFAGGANSVRAFTIRTIGPGHYTSTKASKYSYLDQTGDIKLEGNVEFRFPIFGSLNGAFFLDAGNVWLLRSDDQRPDGTFKLNRFLKDLAVGTGAGLRYDLNFLVLRLDLGVALHNPSDTGKSGYYNIRKFSDGLALHFAIGYPF